MKFFVTFAVLFAVTSARILPPAVIASTKPEIQEIVAAIQSPITDPAIAAVLEQMLLDVLGIPQPEPIQPEPIENGPAIIDFPLPDGGAVTAQPAPAIISPSPLGQIIIKINQNVAGNPVAIATVRQPVPNTVQVVEGPIAPEPVIVVDKPIITPEPVIVVDKPIIGPELAQKPEESEPVIVLEPTMVAPAINIPDILNYILKD